MPNIPNVSTAKSTDDIPTRIFKGAYVGATATLDLIKISEIPHTDPQPPSETSEFIAYICSIYANIKSNFKQSCIQSVRTHKESLQVKTSEQLELFRT